ncbi:MAG: L-2-amino-thiazoline-4-carboxylic acid hydrolase [Desulfobacula sp.]|nr:L-2-amino-thiazoline-4-carboxylic acid hydrolase [Desulfobacula sp.]
MEINLKELRQVHFMYVKQQTTLLNALRNALGSSVAKIAAKAQTESLQQMVMQKANDRSMEGLIQLLWEPLRSQRYEFTIHRSDKGVQIICTACPLAALYQAAGGADWGYHLYCAADEAIVRKFNPDMGFLRTKTIMEGHECCDHFYYMKDGV